MVQRTLVSLGAVEMPPQFSYAPYIPRKRVTVTATADMVVTQASEPQIVHGDGTIAWRCRSCYVSEWTAVWTLYNVSSIATQVFLGYWGESYDVYFSVLDPPRVRGRLWDLSGQFQVADVNTSIAAVCQPPGFPVI